MKKILITNDDGIDSPSLLALVDALKTKHDVTVVAPESQQSAKSHSITLHKPLRLEKRSESLYWLSGTPVDCVYVALNHVCKNQPDLVISGINDGYNLGTDVFYSGTVGAAVEASLRGRPALAVSMAPRSPEVTTAAVDLTLKVVEKMLQSQVGAQVINLNIPKNANGVKWTKLGKRDYGDQVKESIDPRGRPYYWIGGGPLGHHPIEGSDCNAVADSYASLTPLTFSLTHDDTLDSPPWTIDI